MWGLGEAWKIHVPTLQCCCELKTALNNEVFNKKSKETCPFDLPTLLHPGGVGSPPLCCGGHTHTRLCEGCGYLCGEHTRPPAGPSGSGNGDGSKRLHVTGAPLVLLPGPSHTLSLSTPGHWVIGPSPAPWKTGSELRPRWRSVKSPLMVRREMRCSRCGRRPRRSGLRERSFSSALPTVPAARNPNGGGRLAVHGPPGGLRPGLTSELYVL